MKKQIKEFIIEVIKNLNYDPNDLELQKNDALLYDDNQESFETNKKLYEGYHETEINIQREIDDLENEVIEKEKSLDEVRSRTDFARNTSQYLSKRKNSSFLTSVCREDNSFKRAIISEA